MFQYVYSMAAGGLQAISAQFGKVGADASTPFSTSIAYFTCELLKPMYTAKFAVPFDPKTCQTMVAYIARLLSLVLMIVINTTGVALTVKGMQNVGSTLHAVLAVMVNIFCSALLGWFLFGDDLPVQWWLGACIVCIGVGFLLVGESKVNPVLQKTKHE